MSRARLGGGAVSPESRSHPGRGEGREIRKSQDGQTERQTDQQRKSLMQQREGGRETGMWVRETHRDSRAEVSRAQGVARGCRRDREMGTGRGQRGAASKAETEGRGGAETMSRRGQATRGLQGRPSGGPGACAAGMGPGPGGLGEARIWVSSRGEPDQPVERGTGEG